MDSCADNVPRRSAQGREEDEPVMPGFGILNAEPVTAAEIDAVLAAGLGAAGLEQ
jgi:hypothetical protein